MIDVTKMTLNQCWRECLRMWKWIAGRRQKGDSTEVVFLKNEWLEQHGYRRFFNIVVSGCLFCTYDELHPDNGSSCSQCPGKLVQRSWDCETVKRYNYQIKPVEFYEKLVQLNNRRLTKKK